MRILRTAGLWFLIVFGVYGLIVVVVTLLEIRWPNNVVSIVFTIAPLVLLTGAFLALIGVGVYFLFWRRRRRAA